MALNLYNKLPVFIRGCDKQEFKTILLDFFAQNAFYSAKEYLDYEPHL